MMTTMMAPQESVARKGNPPPPHADSSESGVCIKAPSSWKALNSREKRDAKRKLTEGERADGKAKLDAIKRRHAASALPLMQTALTALLEMEALEAQMEVEAEAVHARYAELFDDTKVTFATDYHQLLDERDNGESVTTFENARCLVQAAHDEALALC